MEGRRARHVKNAAFLIGLLLWVAPYLTAGQATGEGASSSQPDRPVAPLTRSRPALLEWDQALQTFERGRKVGDLRCDGCPPFKLEMKLYVPAPDGIAEGHYREIWKSKDLWRQELDLPRFSLLTVRAGTRQARLRNTNHTPVEVIKFLQGHGVNLPQIGPKEWKADVSQRNIDGVAAECVTLRYARDLDPTRIQEYCFDTTTGVLVRKFFGDWKTAWDYSDFSEWNGHRYPREIKVYADGGLAEEARVTSLTPLDGTDESFFAIPAGAVEWTICEKPTPASLATSDPSVARFLSLSAKSRTIVWMEVAPDGGVEDINFLDSRLPAEKAQAVYSTIKKTWKFHPSTCGNTPAPSSFIFEFGLP